MVIQQELANRHARWRGANAAGFSDLTSDDQTVVSRRREGCGSHERRPGLGSNRLVVDLNVVIHIVVIMAATIFMIVTVIAVFTIVAIFTFRTLVA